jgi:hypothetical protein
MLPSFRGRCWKKDRWRNCALSRYLYLLQTCAGHCITPSALSYRSSVNDVTGLPEGRLVRTCGRPFCQPLVFLCGISLPALCLHDVAAFADLAARTRTPLPYAACDAFTTVPFHPACYLLCPTPGEPRNAGGRATTCGLAWPSAAKQTRLYAHACSRALAMDERVAPDGVGWRQRWWRVGTVCGNKLPLPLSRLPHRGTSSAATVSGIPATTPRFCAFHDGFIAVRMALRQDVGSTVWCACRPVLRRNIADMPMPLPFLRWRCTWADSSSPRKTQHGGLDGAAARRTAHLCVWLRTPTACGIWTYCAIITALYSQNNNKNAALHCILPAGVGRLL